MATETTPRSFSHWSIFSNSGVVAPNSCTSRPWPSTVGAHTQWLWLPKSIPATLYRSTGNPSLLVTSIVVSCLSEHESPGWPDFDFHLGESPRGPRQCSIAVPEPDLYWGIMHQFTDGS